jgi:glycosyltransferase involved in cell wall biosynthesis
VPKGLSIAVNAALVGERPTGLAACIVNIVAALDRLGERLIVFTSRPDLFKTARAQVLSAPAALRLERGGAGHMLRLAWTHSVFRARLRAAGADVVLNCVPEGPLGSPVPQVTVVHDLIPLRYPQEYPRQQLYFRHYVPRVLRGSRAIVASSGSTARDLVDFYGPPPAAIRVIPMGHDPERFSPGPPATDSPYALYVGNVMPHKNLLRLLEAFAATELRSRRLVICGWGRRPHVQTLKERVAALGLGPRLEWRPYATDDELVGLYRGARMLLLPSLYEGFGLTALEAMACGTPVIAANLSSLPELVETAALLVDPTDPGAIADAIGRLFADDRLVAELSARGRARARLFPWERTATTLRAVILEAAGRP